jgi:hypothetical protein
MNYLLFIMVLKEMVLMEAKGQSVVAPVDLDKDVSKYYK